MVISQKACFNCGCENCCGCTLKHETYEYTACDICGEDVDAEYYNNGLDMCYDCFFEDFCETNHIEGIDYEDDLDDEMYEGFQRLKEECKI